MAIEARPLPTDELEYPDSDGQPMADNTLQFRWIVTIQGGLDALFRDDPNVFVAGDLLWYPVQGRIDIRRAPDALVAFGRPKGYRGSYIQHREGGIAPQVVFEVRSPKNSRREMEQKLAFYDRFGVEEYYLYDPNHHRLSGFQRAGVGLLPLAPIDGWVSPQLGIRFDMSGPELALYRPDGQRFLTFVELEEERARAEQEHARAEQEHARAEQEHARAERLAAKLRALGVNADE